MTAHVHETCQGFMVLALPDKKKKKKSDLGEFTKAVEGFQVGNSSTRSAENYTAYSLPTYCRRTKENKLLKNGISSSESIS